MAEDGSRQGQGRELSGREVSYYGYKCKTILVQNAVAVVKPRDHTGLQELCALANSVKSFLGPVKSHKFIFDQDTNECTLTCSSFRLLESLDLTSAVGQLFNETVQVHHKIYRTGTTTLFFLVGAWSSAVLDCLRQGVPVAVIASVMLDGLNSCIEQVQTLQQPVYSVHHTNDCVNKKTDTWDENRSDSQGVHNGAQFEQYSKSSVKYINHVPQYWGHKEHSNTKACRNRLTHSRYFTDHERSCLQDKGVRSNELLCKTLGHLAKALCHGNPEIMNLVENAFNRLYENAAEMYGSKVFSPSSQFHICCFPGLSEEHSKASFGYTTLVSLESATVAKFFENKSLHILLLDGELTENYRHLGFNHSANLRVVSSIGSGGDTILDEPWTNTTCRTLIEAKIDLVLVRGDVCPLLMSLCVQRNILVVPQVKQNVLQAFSESTGAEPVVYVTQINQYCIGSGAFVSLYTSGTKVIETSQRIAVNIMAPKLNLITVTLCHRLPSKLQVMEDQFWTCSYRLYHALNNQKVFYGGGAVELLCLNHLKELETIQDYAGQTRMFLMRTSVVM
ncbi:Bardet-Biedl syndrome 12 protein [Spea bombifrons]|uniref:Bardet-Biedl syndrome 12 protein n=1 Tax=Spea bombifrons TaxID=233779 RepID=UPI00234BD40E|nr:Bardet-Biedl syndrome 12 protein [Spea bombifrons]